MKILLFRDKICIVVGKMGITDTILNLGWSVHLGNKDENQHVQKKPLKIFHAIFLGKKIR